MSKKILILDANPSPFSYTTCLANEYSIIAEKNGFDIKVIAIRDLKFDLVLKYGYSRKQPLEPDLENAQELLRWCDHMIVFTPVWWYSMPALLKGFFDRIFLPGFAFKVTKEPKRKVERFFENKIASVIYVYGGPKCNFTDPFKIQIQYILRFVGFKNIKMHCLYNTVGFENMKNRHNFIEKIKNLAKKGE